LVEKLAAFAKLLNDITEELDPALVAEKRTPFEAPGQHGAPATEDLAKQHAGQLVALAWKPEQIDYEAMRDAVT
jgi:hypothetical protein